MIALIEIRNAWFLFQALKTDRVYTFAGIGNAIEGEIRPGSWCENTNTLMINILRSTSDFDLAVCEE